MNIPAFPQSDPIANEFHKKFGTDRGMTLRDYFAAKAMPICYQYWINDFYHPDYPDAEDRNAEGRDDFGGNTMNLIAEYAYSMADAMLKAREEGEK